MEPKTQKPNVFDFLDFVSFLRAYYCYRKELQSDFSYESWAQELGYNSKSFLRLIAIGKKKPSSGFVEVFCRQVFADKNQIEYFKLLFKYEVEISRDKKSAYLRQIVRHMKYEKEYRLISDQNNFVVSPLIPRLFSILSFKDVRASADFCARILGIDIEEVKQALLTLSRLNLAESVGTGDEEVWIARHDVFHVPEQLGSEALMHYHEKSLQDAVKAFGMPKELRKYKTMLMPLSPEEVHEFNSSLDHFMADQMQKYNSSNLAGKRMFQTNLNFHSVTEEW